MFRTIEILFLVTAIVLLGVLVFRIFKERKIAILSGVLALVFLPITFEHAVPNAFVIVVCQPLILLLLSILLYLDYCEYKKRRYVILSCVFFFWGCCLYEFVVTYVIVFFAISLLKQKGGGIIFALRESKYNIVTALIYLLCYVIQGKFVPTNYSGTTINLFNLKGILKVLKVEWLSALPGYYLFNKKYKYLHNIYQIEINIDELVLILVFIISLLSVLLFLLNDNRSKLKARKYIAIALLAGGYTVLPTIPNALTVLYQESVSENFFTSIPVSLFLYFAMIILLTIGIRILADKNRKLLYTIVGGICLLGTCTYITNSGIAKQQFQDYQRLVSIEQLLSSGFFSGYEELEIEAPSLYETRNNLAIEEGHWTRYISLYIGGNIDISASQDNSGDFIQMQKDNSFFMSLNGQNYYVTKNDFDNEMLVKDITENDILICKNDLIWQKGEYMFYLVQIE